MKSTPKLLSLMFSSLVNCSRMLFWARVVWALS